MKNNNNFKKVVTLLVAVLFISGVSVANLGLVKSADAAGSKYSKSVLELQKCLPEGVALDTVVSTTTLADGTILKTTVGDTLKELGAKCSKGKLVDKKGKEIVFYFLTGCWGTVPPDADQIVANQQNEINTLSKTYTVVLITCNPTGLPIQ